VAVKLKHTLRFSKLAKRHADIGPCHNSVVAEYVLKIFTQLRGELID